MNKKSKAAKLLGSSPKHYSKEEIAKRTARLAEARKNRWIIKND